MTWSWPLSHCKMSSWSIKSGVFFCFFCFSNLRVWLPIKFRPTVHLQKRHQIIQFFKLYNDTFKNAFWCSFFLEFSFLADIRWNTSITVASSLALHFNSSLVLCEDNFLAVEKPESAKMTISCGFVSFWHSKVLSMFWNAYYGCLESYASIFVLI